jgi:tetratricopeptide (TPR) repeat protein
MIDIRGPCLTNLYASMGDKVRAKAELEKSLKESPNQSPYHFARGFIAIGDLDKAISYLQRAYEVRDIRIWHIKVDPAVDPIRNDPRLKPYFKKLIWNNHFSDAPTGLKKIFYLLLPEMFPK